MKLCEEHGFQANIAQEAPHWLTILQLVGAGLGVTIAPECVRKAAGDTVACRSVASPGTSYIELAYRPDEHNPVVQEFGRLARKLFQGKNV